MNFSTKEDVDVPIEAVFAKLCDFESFEREASRKGVQVSRTDGKTGSGPDARWNVRFPFQGRRVDAVLSVQTCAPPNELVLDAESEGMSGLARFELMSLSPTRTRMMVSFDIKPKTMAARLMIQSARLAKANLTKRFKLRVAKLAHGFEERYRRERPDPDAPQPR